MPFPAAEPLARFESASHRQRERAWAEFLNEHNDLLLRVARSLGGDHDAIMGRYTFVLEQLRRDEFRRLRSYASDGRGKFTTWLVAVVRRLCVDEHRRRYGRPQRGDAGASEEWIARRNLVDLVGDELEMDSLHAGADTLPDAALEAAEVRTALDRALSDLELSDRLLLRFRFEDELSVPEIARLLGDASPFQLYRRLTKVLARLRKELTAVGIEDVAS